MALYRVLATIQNGADFSDLAATNTFYLDAAPASEPIDANALALDVRMLYQSALGAVLSNDITYADVRLYQMGAGPTGPPKGTSKGPITVSGGSPGIREVALCLSYQAAPVPRRRGRMYMGPFKGSIAAGARPAASLQNALLDFGDGIAALGGINIRWEQYSTTDGVSNPVNKMWVDDAWDTQRSRGLSPTSRITRTTAG